MSNNDVFFEAEGDLDRAKDLLLVRGIDPSVAGEVFRNNEHNLQIYSQLVVSVGRRYMELHGESPLAFIRRYLGVYHHNLLPEDEVRLRQVLEREFLVVEEQIINQDTNVLVLEQRHSCS